MLFECAACTNTKHELLRFVLASSGPAHGILQTQRCVTVFDLYAYSFQLTDTYQVYSTIQSLHHVPSCHSLQLIG